MLFQELRAIGLLQNMHTVFHAQMTLLPHFFLQKGKKTDNPGY